MKSVQAALNRYTASWKTRKEVNSTIQQLDSKIDRLRKTRSKELKNSTTLEQKVTIRKRYDNEIKYYDDLLYRIKLDYYEIVSKL